MSSCKNRLSSYGLSVAEYNQLLSNQNNCCAICGKPPNGKRLAVDHNHVTSRVRGLLCFRCNTLLGLAFESVQILQNACDYMRKHSEIDKYDTPEFLVERLKADGF